MADGPVPSQGSFRAIFSRYIPLSAPPPRTWRDATGGVDGGRLCRATARTSTPMRPSGAGRERSRPVSTLPRAAAPGGPARVGGVGPLGPFPPGAGMAPRDLPAARGRAAGSPAGAECPGQPRAQVSPLRKAAVPRSIEQMGRSRARMGGPQPGSPTGRTAGSRQTNWLRPTAIRRSDGFPGALRDRHAVARGVPAPALRAGRHGIPWTGAYCGPRDLPAALPGTGRPDSAALESHGAVQSDH